MNVERAQGPSRTGNALLAVVLALIALVHLANFASSLDDPYLRFRVGDESEYHDWAQKIAQGQVLRERSFFTTPLYAYFLGAFYSLGIHQIAAVRFINVLLVLGAVVITARTARVLFPSSASAVIPVILLGLCLSPLFYELAPEKTSLVLFLCALTMHLVVAGTERPGPARWFIAGLAGGATTLAHALFLLFLPSVLVTLLVLRRNRPFPAGTVLLAFCAGFALAILPATLHNFIVDRDLVLVNSNGGQNFYTGNAAQNRTGMYLAPSFATATLASEEQDFAAAARAATGRRMQPSETSRYWYRRGWDDIAADPLLAIRRFVRRMQWTFSSLEIRDTRTFQFYRDRLPVLGLPLWNFGLIAALGLAGMVLAFTDGRFLFINVFILCFSTALSLFFVFGRYRLPLIVPLSFLACVTLTRAWSVLRVRDGSRAVGIGAAVVLASLAVFGGQGPELRPFHADPVIDLINQGNNYLRIGEYDRAAGELTRAIALQPSAPDVDTAVAKLAGVHMRMDRDAEAASLLTAYLDLHGDSPVLWEEFCTLGAKRTLAPAARRAEGAGDARRNAVTACERALRLKPNSLSSAMNLAALHIREGRLEQADAVYRDAGTWFEDSPSLWLRMSKFHFEYLHDLERALGEAERAVLLDKQNPGAVTWLEKLRREQLRRASGGAG